MQSVLTDTDGSYTQGKQEFDDDGRPKRTGTLFTASSHIVTAVIGSGVLSLSWATAQLGWIAGPVALVAFSVITWFCSVLLTDCYRSPDPITGTRNYTYSTAVKNILGGVGFKLCGLAQYSNLIGVTIGYTITTAISMAAVKRSHCFHHYGHNAECHVSINLYMICFGIIQIVLSQIPNFHDISWLSIVAAVMSVTYSFIGLGLSAAAIAEKGHHVRTSLTGVAVGIDVTAMDKVWRTLQSLGNIAFAYSFSNVLIEIEDTLKSSPPECQVMKKASAVGIGITTTFYMLCGLLGYSAFGNAAPGNFLTGFGFYEPFWLIDIANICIAVHLIGAYQVFAQPVFHLVEKACSKRWPDNKFINTEHMIKLPLVGDFPFSLFRSTWRIAYIVFTTILATIFPFFNDILGLLGALSFWPLTVFFPIEMYMRKQKMPRCSASGFMLNLVSGLCLVVSILAAAGSIQGLTESLKSYKPFKD